MKFIFNNRNYFGSSKYKFWAFLLLFHFFVKFANSSELNESERVKDYYKAQKVSFIFAGDIMAHLTQIKAANIYGTKKYDFTPWFQHVSTILKNYDFAIGNLETTFAGEPYSGYPAFSCPDTFACFLKSAGFNVMVTANNHSSDRGFKGIKGTINGLNKAGILHTGSFTGEVTKSKSCPLYLEKNGLKIALLNYTYGTNNGVKNLLINTIDTNIIKKDIASAKNEKTDAIIIFLHWGKEYERVPNSGQKALALFCHRNGVDAVIGSHPHVIQQSEKIETLTGNDRFVTFCIYSLGNFISNQRWRYSDGGLMVGFDIVKKSGEYNVSLENIKYEPVWIHKHFSGNTKLYEIVPVNQYKSGEIKLDLNQTDEIKIRTFIEDVQYFMK